MELVAATEIPGELEVDGTLVGGLSGLTYDPACDLFYAVSDDRGSQGPVRLYTLRMGLGDPPSVEVLDAIVFRETGGELLRRGDFDFEGLGFDSAGALLIASEGAPHRGVQPSVEIFGLDGVWRGALGLPKKFLADAGGTRGVRNNLAFEGVAVGADGRLFLATENALHQDGPVADLGIGSPARLLVLDPSSGRTVAEYLYLIDPAPDEPVPPNAFRTNGVSEIVSIDENRLLVIERAFSAGVGNRVRLFLVDLRLADDIQGIEALADHPGTVRPLPKTLVADLDHLGVEPDNIEAAAFGPALADGRRLLVLAADNNFQPSVQSTQVVLLAVSGVAPPAVQLPELRVAAIQGAGHSSPYAGRCVRGVEGVVTAILGSRSGQAFWVQDPVGDADPATSEGLLVTAPAGLEQVEVGDLVRLAGRVEERSWGLELPVTRLFASSAGILARGRELPPQVRLGAGGVVIPQPEIAAPGLSSFEASRFAADAFESLEGMRVRVEGAVVVGPTSRHGEAVVLADGGRDAELRTARGGLRLLEHNPNPQRLIIDDALVADEPLLTVGDRLAGPVDAILHYGYGSYKLLNTAPLPDVAAGGLARERTALTGSASQLTVASYNVENLSAVSDDDRFRRFAEVVVRHLGSPDIVALQEIQDDTGPADDGTVSAAGTMTRIVEAIAALGGARYEWRSVDPRDGESGGQPGANIRNAFLFNPARVGFVDRGACGALAATEAAPGPALSCSPGLLDPTGPAFAPRPDGEGGSRKPLVGQFRFAGSTLFLVNLHLASKGGDDPLFGRRQPPVEASSVRRVRQAEAVAAFVAGLRELDPGVRVVVLGDLNDFEGSAPLRALEAAGLENLMLRLPLAESSTYVFLGNSQVLDHVLVTPILAAGAEVDAVHLNAEFPAADRAGDHDPVLVRLSFER